MLVRVFALIRDKKSCAGGEGGSSTAQRSATWMIDALKRASCLDVKKERKIALQCRFNVASMWLWNRLVVALLSL